MKKKKDDGQQAYHGFGIIFISLKLIKYNASTKIKLSKPQRTTHTTTTEKKKSQERNPRNPSISLKSLLPHRSLKKRSKKKTI